VCVCVCVFVCVCVCVSVCVCVCVCVCVVCVCRVCVCVFILYNDLISHLIHSTPQQLSAEPRNSASSEALFCGRANAWGTGRGPGVGCRGYPPPPSV